MDAAKPSGFTKPVTALLVATMCSSSATLASDIALGKLVFDITGSELDLGLLGLAEFAPAFLLVFVTGVVADRFDRRRVAAAGMGIELAAAVALVSFVASEPTSIGPIFVLVLVFGTGRAFAAPATRSMPADMVVPERLPWLMARYSVTWQIALIVGPVLGGTLYALDPTYPFVAMVALLAVGVVAILQVRTEKPAAAAALEAEEKAAKAERPSLHDATEGFRFIRSRPVLLGAISLDLFAVLFGGAVALLPAIATERLHVDAAALGWLRAAGGIGAAVTTFGLTRRPVTRNVGRTLLVVVAIFGVFTIVLGATRSYWVAFVAMVVLSGADAISVFIRSTLVPLVTPAAKRGRVLAVENVFIGASNELGAFESGVAGQVLGPSAAVVLGGVMTLGVALGWWRLFPGLRDVDRFPDQEPESAGAG
jgi:MFS family permease